MANPAPLQLQYKESTRYTPLRPCVVYNALNISRIFYQTLYALYTMHCTHGTNTGFGQSFPTKFFAIFKFRAFLTAYIEIHKGYTWDILGIY